MQPSQPLLTNLVALPRYIPLPATALSVGTDICHVPRIARLLRGPHAARLIRRLVVPADQTRAYLMPFLGSRGVQHEEDVVCSAARFVAGRFAAKEAVIKAYAPFRRLLLGDVAVYASVGAPLVLVASGRDAADGCAAAGYEQVAVSISHDGEYATAVCLAQRRGRG